jgi:hypothetical protein
MAKLNTVNIAHTAKDQIAASIVLDEKRVRSETIEAVIHLILNDYKNNIYWKWACNDIAEAIRAKFK